MDRFQKELASTIEGLLSGDNNYKYLVNYIAGINKKYNNKILTENALDVARTLLYDNALINALMDASEDDGVEIQEGSDESVLEEFCNNAADVVIGFAFRIAAILKFAVSTIGSLWDGFFYEEYSNGNIVRGLGYNFWLTEKLDIKLNMQSKNTKVEISLSALTKSDASELFFADNVMAKAKSSTFYMSVLKDEEDGSGNVLLVNGDRVKLDTLKSTLENLKTNWR